jgi:hypothetical protein
MTGTQSRLWDVGAYVGWRDVVAETERGTAAFSVSTCATDRTTLN